MAKDNRARGGYSCGGKTYPDPTPGVRGSGHTRKMVAELKPGSIVIVHTAALVDYVRAMIYDLRGSEFARTCRVLCIYQEYDARRNLAGVDRFVSVDHAFWDFCPNEAARQSVFGLSERANSRARSRA